MTEIALQGQILPAVMQPGDPRSELLARLTAAWLARLPSKHSRTAYERDLRDWLTWCASTGVHPLSARMSDVDDWIAAQRTAPAKRSGTGPVKYSDEAVAALYERWKAGGVSKSALAREAGMAPSGLAKRFETLERRRGAGPASRGAAKRSIARRVYAVRSWYGYLIRNTISDPEPLIAYNPADTDATPKAGKGGSPTIALSRDEADRLIAAADADGLRSSAIIRLLLTNADRRGVIETVQITDLGNEKEHRVLTRTIKGADKVRDPIPPPTMQAIKAYLASRGDPETGPLFVTATGGPMLGQYVYDLVKRLARNAAISSADKITPHSLRATAITETIEMTGDITRGQRLGRHAHVSTTQIYDKREDGLDNHPSYLLATRYGVRGNS